MKSLYAIIGVSKSATPEAIRKAYRKQSRKAHPDTGGSNEAFAELKLAYDVLIDPVRRKRYDDSGSFDDSGPDNSQSAGMEWIFKALDQTLAAMVKYGMPVDSTDLKSEMVAWLKKVRHDIDKGLQEFHTKATVWKSIKGKFVAADGDTSMESLIDKTISVTNEIIRSTERQRDHLDIGLNMLAKYTFKYTKKEGFRMSPIDSILFIGFGR